MPYPLLPAPRRRPLGKLSCRPRSPPWQASADASAAANQVLDSLASVDDEEYQQPNPNDPMKFFQQASPGAAASTPAKQQPCCLARPPNPSRRAGEQGWQLPRCGHLRKARRAHGCDPPVLCITRMDHCGVAVAHTPP